jgi:hypothetical protein
MEEVEVLDPYIQKQCVLKISNKNVGQDQIDSEMKVLYRILLKNLQNHGFPHIVSYKKD